jgi:uncharacterized protein YydD (DUF2326 family)
MCDVWGLSCTKLINQDQYKLNCLEKSLITQSGLFFKTSAESTFQFLIDDYGFVEEHTALGDVVIESQILLKVLKKGTLEKGIQYFPFNELGETVDFITKRENLKKICLQDIQNVIDVMWAKYGDYNKVSSFASQLESKILRLERYAQTNFDKLPSEEYYLCRISLVEKQIQRKTKYLEKLKFMGDSWYDTKRQINRLEEEIAKLMVEKENMGY